MLYCITLNKPKIKLRNIYTRLLSKKTVVLRLKIICLAIILPCLAYSQAEPVPLDFFQSFSWYIGIFFGVILFNIVVSLAQYILSKDKAYLFYFAFLVLNLLYFIHYAEFYGEANIFFNRFFPSFTESANPRIAFLLLGYVMYYYFAIEFLKLHTSNPKLTQQLKRLAWTLMVVLGIYTFCYQILGWSMADETYKKYKRVHDFTILSASIIGVIGIYIVARTRTKLANVLILGASFYFIGSFIGFIATVYYEQLNSFFYKYPLLPTQLGFFFEILLFSIGLAYRAYLYEKEKDETNEKYIQQLQENQELELGQKEALKYKEINEFKSRLYTNITHEFRTPLTVIMGMTEQLQNEPKKNIQPKLETIERNSKQLLDLVIQLLDLSRLEEGSLKPKYAQGEIINFLSYITESYQSFALSKKRTLSFYSEVESDFLMDYDAEKMQRILINLLSNALKFTPEQGQIHVIVKKDKKDLLVIVKDNGQGIPKEALPLVFDRFYQVDDSMNGAGGTGIGLALVMELTQLLDGKIDVESEVDKGTIFKLKFPIRNNAELEKTDTPQIEEHLFPSKANEPSIIPNSTTTQEVFGDEKPILLIIEDNIDVAEYLESCLSPNYKFIFARNGERGIEEAIENIPDIIISDVMMPNKNGFEVCETLKTDNRTNHIPIILLTAKTTKEDRLEGLSHGADAYLSKPFNKQELLIRLDKLVELRKNILEKNNLKEAEKPQDEFLQKVYNVVLENIEDDSFNVPHLCKALVISRAQLHRKITALTNHSTTQFVRIIRLQEAYRLLKIGDYNVSEVAYKVGYKSAANFSTHFKKHFGFSPSETSK